MIGRGFWIWVWYGLLAIGILGLLSSLYWGRRTRWQNLDEILRALGTLTVSLGMLLILNGVGGGAGEILLVAAMSSFMLAFVLGRREPDPPDPEDAE